MRETPSLLSQPAHIVIIVHGFRTFGRWQDALELLIQKCPQTKVYKYNYGVSGAPILGWIAADHFRRDLVEIATQYPDARIDIVAHGCGARVVGWGLIRCAKTRCPEHPHSKTLMCPIPQEPSMHAAATPTRSLRPTRIPAGPVR